MKKIFLLFLALSILGQTSFAEPLGPYRLLRKISRELRGIDPTDQEMDALADLEKNNPDQISAFMKTKAEEYTKSKEYIAKTELWLEHLYQFNPYQYNNFAQGYPPAGTEATKALFTLMAKDNLNWDTLLTGYQYKQFSNDNDVISFYGGGPDPADQSYFAYIPEIALQKTKPTDPRLAGILTTKRFWIRYGASEINQNRRQAAAVFKIALCDPMKPVFVVDKKIDRKFIEKTFKIKAGTKESTLSAEDQNAVLVHMSEMQKRHGTEVSCMACHYKLDPLGQSFTGNEVGLSPDPAPGMLQFYRANHKLKQIKGQGIGDITRKLVQLPEYQGCQVKHFWSRYVSNEVRPTQEQINSMVTAFNSPEIGRKINNFVVYLTAQPEFMEADLLASGSPFSQSPQALTNKLLTPETASKGFVPLTPEQESVRTRAMPLLQRCNNCHDSRDVEDVPDFTKLSNNSPEDKFWIHKANVALNKPDNADRSMPYDRSMWKPEDLAAVKAYFRMLEGTK